MRRIVFFISVFLLLNACEVLKPSYSSAGYSLSEPYPYPWLDMSKGTWVIYDLDIHPSVATSIEKQVFKDFEGLLGDKLIDAEIDDNLLIDKSLDTDFLDEEALKKLAETSQIDYIILVKVKEGKETYAYKPNLRLDYTEEDQKSLIDVYLRNCYANIKIYNVQEGQLVFNRSCKATVEVEDKQPIDFSPSNKKMMKKAYKKLFKSLSSEVIR